MHELEKNLKEKGLDSTKASPYDSTLSKYLAGLPDDKEQFAEPRCYSVQDITQEFREYWEETVGRYSNLKEFSQFEINNTANHGFWLILDNVQSDLKKIENLSDNPSAGQNYADSSKSIEFYDTTNSLVSLVLERLLLSWALWIKTCRINLSLRGQVLKAAERRYEDGETQDGKIRWSVTDEETGELTVSFGSYCMELSGTKIQLSVGEISKVIELRMVEKDQIEAEAVFTREERKRIKPGTLLELKYL